MVDGLLINGLDAFDTYGAIMGDDFLQALDTPAALKDFLTFDSRVVDGTEYLTDPNYIKQKARDLTLKFRIFADDSDGLTLAERQASLQTRKSAFMATLNVGTLTIKVPSLNNNTYHLVYTGQSISYELNNNRTTCLIGAKFVEPDPTNHS